MIDFLKWRSASYVFSLTLLLAFAGTCVYRYQTRGHIFSYSIDFTGGVQLLFRADGPIGDISLKDALSLQGWDSATIRTLSGNEFIVRVKEFVSETKGLAQSMLEGLQTTFPEKNIVLLENESVGPGVGETLRWKAMYAVFLGLITLLAYIALRFWSFAYGTGAVIALAHDAFILLALILFLDREISVYVIGGILAILGYSINDTIVIFSQIRDTLKKRSGESLENIVNISLNKTLKRTILTSVSTGLPVTIMFLFGGEALHDLSLVLLVGIIFGTYSSIYVASPVMMYIRSAIGK